MLTKGILLFDLSVHTQRVPCFMVVTKIRILKESHLSVSVRGGFPQLDGGTLVHKICRILVHFSCRMTVKRLINLFKDRGDCRQTQECFRFDIRGRFPLAGALISLQADMQAARVALFWDAAGISRPLYVRAGYAACSTDAQGVGFDNPVPGVSSSEHSKNA